MYDLCQRMTLAESKDSLNQMISSYFSQQGISSLAFTYYSQHTKTGSKLIYQWATPALRAWHQHYLDEGYADIDRTLESSEQSLLPVYWDVHEQLAASKNKREARIREESIEFGIDKGLSISIHGPAGDFFVLVVHQRVKETGLSGWQEKQYPWIAIALCYFHHLRQFLLREAVEDSTLTKRERQCLQLTSQGLRIDNIAKALDISRRTVNFHIQNANKKLGVSNKYLAIMRWNEQEDED
ncbi:Transcriptional activator protein LuxR [Legionella massiliensis]|uniref:Transcriptional activator protein LuxR n=1 Tax=Legionella massiliensis TaxID=1034943 RepID=A0A078L4R8_9GAMM|nr:LuxR family transcriptional regulator [Legionella massiliensis]CDZ78903.1 Transcriptional activator protein LuxR [Legionella massiliensis]CEE14641.1 Transcriptional activator protein LuxR [Legionella massiliensis]